LPGFEPAIRLVDDVHAPLASDDAVITVARAQRFPSVVVGVLVVVTWDSLDCVLKHRRLMAGAA
jgi:hypothetical protein